MSEPSADPLRQRCDFCKKELPEGEEDLCEDCIVAALAAHPAAPIERQSDQLMLGRAYEAALISEEYIDQGGYELVNKAHFDAHVESIRAAAALSQDKPTVPK